jgi:hypothetical protein
VTSIILGILGRGLHLFEVAMFGFAFLSNHRHLLYQPASAHVMSRFEQFLSTEIRRRVGAVIGWRGTFWQRRFRHIPVQPVVREIERLHHLFLQGCQENLVGAPLEWPGACSHRALTTGEPLVGRWVNYGAYARAARTSRDACEEEFATYYEIPLHPLPSFADMTDEAYRRLCAGLSEQVAEETARRHARDGTRPLGVEAILAGHPHDEPVTTKTSPAPLVHAADADGRRAYADDYRAFCDDSRAAFDLVKGRLAELPFPRGAQIPGCIPVDDE